MNDETPSAARRAIPSTSSSAIPSAADPDPDSGLGNVGARPSSYVNPLRRPETIIRPDPTEEGMARLMKAAFPSQPAGPELRQRLIERSLNILQERTSQERQEQDPGTAAGKQSSPANRLDLSAAEAFRQKVKSSRRVNRLKNLRDRQDG